MAEKIVIALGGNALQSGKGEATAEAQLNVVKKTCEHLADISEKGYEIGIVHGNGPQVGRILLASETAKDVTPAMPFDVCGAMSQGYIGYHIQEALKYALSKRNRNVPVATIVTQVVVEKQDPAFQNPTKPIGPFYTEEEAAEEPAEMTDEEMIRKLYHLRNTVMAREHVGSALKGTNTRYLSAEPQMALDMLYGYTTIDSHINYGGGVEWHGNPFIGTISTIAGSMRTDYYASQSDAEKASGSDAEKEEIAVVSDEPEEEEEIGPGIVLRKKLEAESRAAEEASRAAEETAQTETETGI